MERQYLISLLQHVFTRTGSFYMKHVTQSQSGLQACAYSSRGDIPVTDIVKPGKYPWTKLNLHHKYIIYFNVLMVFPLRYQITELQSWMEMINSVKTSCLCVRARGVGVTAGWQERKGWTGVGEVKCTDKNQSIYVGVPKTETT